MVMIADFLTGDQELSQEFCVWRLTSPGHSVKLFIGKRRTHSRNGFMFSLKRASTLASSGTGDAGFPMLPEMLTLDAKTP